MRRLWGAQHPTEPRVQPPEGQLIELQDWFDDGSFCRWVLRNLPELDDILPAVLDALPRSLGAELQEALVTASTATGDS